VIEPRGQNAEYGIWEGATIRSVVWLKEKFNSGNWVERTKKAGSRPHSEGIQKGPCQAESLGLGQELGRPICKKSTKGGVNCKNKSSRERKPLGRTQHKQTFHGPDGGPRAQVGESKPPRQVHGSLVGGKLWGREHNEFSGSAISNIRRTSAAELSPF